MLKIHCVFAVIIAICDWNFAEIKINFTVSFSKSTKAMSHVLFIINSITKRTPFVN